jgi:hypothetical protein
MKATAGKILFILALILLIASACAPKVTPIPATSTPANTPTPIPPTATEPPPKGKIEGRVFIAHSDKSLAGATVTLSDYDLRQPVAQATTDGQGLYTIGNVEPGKYSLSVMWEFTDRNDCPGSNMFGPSIMLFQKEDGGYILTSTAFPQFEMTVGEAAKLDIRLLCK